MESSMNRVLIVGAEGRGTIGSVAEILLAELDDRFCRLSTEPCSAFRTMPPQPSLKAFPVKVLGEDGGSTHAADWTACDRSVGGRG